MTGQDTKQDHLPTALLLAALTCFAYAVVFLYDAGWLGYHGLPLYLVDLELPRVFLTLAGFGSVLLVFFVASFIVPIGIRKVWRTISILLFLVLLTAIFVLSLFHIPRPWLLAAVVGLLDLGLILLVISSIRQNRSKGFAEWFHAPQSRHSPRPYDPDEDTLIERFVRSQAARGFAPRITLLTIAGALFVLLAAYQAGQLEAFGPSRTLVSTANPRILLLRIAGTRAILGERTIPGDTLLNNYRIVTLDQLHDQSWRAAMIRLTRGFRP